MANAGIYQANPLKSVADYVQDWERVNVERQRGENLRQENAIRSAAIGEAERSRRAQESEANAFAALVEGAGGDEQKLAQSLRFSGRSSFMKRAEEMEKAAADAAKVRADAGKTQGETRDAAFKMYRGHLDYIDTPQGAARWLQAQYADPVVGPVLQGIRPFDEAVQGIPADQQAFQQWRVQAGVGMEKVQQWAKEREIAEGQRRTTERGQDITAATSRANNAATNATTRRGQDLGDARARDLAALKQIELGQAATAKREAAATKEVDGKRVVDEVVGSLRQQYDALDQAGGITNPDKGSLSNFSAGVQSSGVGQAAGRLFGTQNQSSRNIILQQRPALLHAIMKATGMSAKQLDSNAELKLMLSTATDPQLDVAANRAALDLIESLYGTESVKNTGGASGSFDAAAAPAPKAGAPQTATNPQTGERLELRNGRWVPAK
jgi:hypothetical protein